MRAPDAAGSTIISVNAETVVDLPTGRGAGPIAAKIIALISVISGHHITEISATIMKQRGPAQDRWREAATLSPLATTSMDRPSSPGRPRAEGGCGWAAGGRFLLWAQLCADLAAEAPSAGAVSGGSNGRAPGGPGYMRQKVK